MSHQHHHCHSHGNHHEGECCGGHHHECCHEDSCHHHHHDHEEECCADFAQHLLEVADEAWMEVLKEKIKKHVETKSGKKLDKLAEFIASSNHTRWKNKMGAKKACSDYEEKVAEYLCGGD